MDILEQTKDPENPNYNPFTYRLDKKYFFK
jgi:hypothetical protein